MKMNELPTRGNLGTVIVRSSPVKHALASQLRGYTSYFLTDKLKNRID